MSQAVAPEDTASQMEVVRLDDPRTLECLKRVNNVCRISSVDHTMIQLYKRCGVVPRRDQNFSRKI